jgi:hypothetical protein
MLGHSIVSQHFMELEGSIPNSQELSTCSYPEPDQSSPHLIEIYARTVRKPMGLTSSRIQPGHSGLMPLLL